jgi:Raf kinase inhibitor-like YbhB/YbcL family protein
MKRAGITALVALILLIGWVAYTLRTQHTDDSTKPRMTTMKITSSAFAENGAIPQQYSCQGKGMNPPLELKEVPKDAQSVALVVDDPDAPGRTFDHWVIWNISPETTEIAENAVPSGAVQGNNGSGELGWTAPCPPSGTHHYHFKLYALDGPLALPQGATKSELEAVTKGHIVAQAELVGTYTKE